MVVPFVAACSASCSAKPRSAPRPATSNGSIAALVTAGVATEVAVALAVALAARAVRPDETVRPAVIMAIDATSDLNLSLSHDPYKGFCRRILRNRRLTALRC